MFLVLRDFLTVLCVFLTLLLVFWLESSSFNEELAAQREAAPSAYAHADSPHHRMTRVLAAH